MSSAADVLHVLRRAVRTLARSPLYTFTATVALALGVGANVVVFSVASAVLLRPLPYTDPGSLYWVTNVYAAPAGGAGGTTKEVPASGLEYLRWKAESQAFSGVEALTTRQMALTGDGEPETVTAGEVSTGLFALLGAPVERGRGFDASEDVPRSGVVIVSHEFWQRRLAVRGSALGQKLVLDGEPRVVIGVMPSNFRPLMQSSDVWVPLGLTGRTMLPPTARYLYVVGRARPGRNATHVALDLREIGKRLLQESPQSQRGWTASAVRLSEHFASSDRGALLALLTLVGFLLLLASINVANLTLARVVRRRGESALRLALGASPAQLLEMPLAETAVLAAFGGGVGVLFATLAVGPIAALDPESLPLLHMVRIDGRVLAFAAGVTTFAAFACSLVPIAYVRRLSPMVLLAEGSARTAGGVRDRRARRVLMTAQITLALLLLLGAVSTIRLLHSLGRVSLGFDPANVIAVELTLPDSRYPTVEGRAALVTELLARVRGLPGVQAASATSNRFILSQGLYTTVATDDMVATSRDPVPAHFRRVSADYFEVMRIPLLFGRSITETDRREGLPVAVVSRALATSLWPSKDPIGKRVKRTAAGTPWLMVVGVVEDVRDLGLTEPPGSTLYVPYAQDNRSLITLLVRTNVGVERLSRVLADAVHTVDPLQPIDRLQPLSRYLGDSLRVQRYRALLLAVFAGLGLVLAATGVYGVTSYLLAARTRELAVRMALGARSHDVVRLLAIESLRWVALGVGLGLVLAVLLARAARTALTGVVEFDAASAAVVVVIVVAASLVSTIFPTWRVARTPPAVAFRGDV